LKSEAESNLVPTWRIVTLVAGREVPATIRIGSQTYTAPRAFTLEAGQRYTAEFEYEAGGKRYRADAVTVTADWKGERERLVTLEEVRGPVAGGNARVEDLGLDLVWVAPGSFRMGSDSGDSGNDERPVREVRISRGYWMGKYEVTNGEYQRFVREAGYNGRGEADSDYLKHFSSGSNMPTDDRHPVVWVSWNNAVAFCKWLTERERKAGRLPAGYEYRLPTEAEWEYAARGGSGSRGYAYSGGNDIGSVAWYDSNSGGKTHPVGGKQANELGIYDMSGNVWEWCYDWYDSGYYGKSPGTDPVNTNAASNRVERGGCWLDSSRNGRSAYRYRYRPEGTNYGLGFRVCLAPQIRE